jgi:hypothetical protein
MKLEERNGEIEEHYGNKDDDWTDRRKQFDKIVNNIQRKYEGFCGWWECVG